MKKSFIISALMAISVMNAAATEVKDGARLLRFPATNGSEVVFSYAGDLYRVPISGGDAVRLTSHKGYEMFARYSPDGRSIAFTGEYDGNREVYLMPATGGAPVRLTYTSTNERDDLGDRMGPNNIVMAWTPDGKGIIYRNRIGDGFPGNLWKVPADGAMPEKLPLPEGGFCCYSPDGKKFAYNRVMREFRTWKYYRGGMADDIWIYDGKKVENITQNDAQDIFPMWCGNEIYFASDRDMTMNIFVYDTRTGTTSKVTDFHDYDVKFPSTDGRMIVFEQAGWIWKLDPSTKKYEKIDIRLASDDIQARAARKNVRDYFTGAGVSPDGRRLAVTARGEVFNVPAEKGVTRNISRTPGAHERAATWSPDGKSIAYISDRTGETEVWLQSVEDELQEPVQLTDGNDSYIRTLRWSPDGKKLLYTDRKNRVVEIDPATKGKKVLLQDQYGELRPSYSADSRWLTYTRTGANNMSVVYVYDIAAGKEYAVTEKWYDSFAPAFSEDGKYLVFTCNRDFNPTYSSVEWDFAYNNLGSIYMAMLAKDTASPLLPKDGPDAPAADAGGPKAEKSGDRKEAAQVRVDPDGIAERIVKLPFKGGRPVYCDGKKLWHTAGRGVKVFDFANGKDEDCCDGSISYRFGDKSALVMAGKGDISVARFPADKVKGEKVDLGNMTADVDYTQEWEQIFDEVWRAFRDGFYLENMHGRDWKAVKEKYAALVPYAKTRLDLNYVLSEMISELACGHAYVTVGEYDKPERISMGLLGAEMSKDRSGFFRIDRILEGANYSESLRSPLREPGMDVAEGSFITAVDGVSTKDVANIYRLLAGKAGVLTELTVNEKAAAGGRKVVVRPISDEYPLYHYEWIRKCMDTVDRLSGGKVGYIYIPDMGTEGLNEFARYFYPQLDKEALIIDDRENGGGNVSPMIIERLQRKAYRLENGRGSIRVETTPDAVHTGPKVLLVNKYSASDGDLFPWGFKANKLGTVIGTRSWGGIIGIGGSLPYMDNTDVRVPTATSFDPETGQWIIENHGVDPDIVLDNDPVKEAAGIDQQLEKAVEVALEQIKERKALPTTPAPRTFRDLGLPESW